MSASKAIQDIIEILKGVPAAVIGPDRIGFSGPAAGADLPVIAVAVSGAREGPAGIGAVAGLASSGGQWTTTTGTRTAGQLRIELWTAGVASMNQLTSAVLTQLAASGAALNSSGFTAFETAAIRAAEGMRLPDSTTALRAVLEYSIVHEEVTSVVSGPGGAIKEIDVAIDGQFNEQMTVK